MALKLAILASGSGTNAERIIKLCQSGKLQARVCLLVSNNPQARVLERARSLNTPFLALDHHAFKDRLDFDRRLARILREADCELLVLAGYMRLLSGEFLEEFRDRAINIHPALLPSFPGIHGARDAVEYGVKISGASVHFVEEKMDAGPLIIQGAVPVMAGERPEALQERIHAVEYKIYPQAIQWIAQQRLEMDGRQIRLKDMRTKGLAQPEGAFIWPPLEDDFTLAENMQEAVFASPAG